MAALDVVSICKTFGELSVLQDVSFRADDGEVVCLLGPSGCGKTTLLRIIAGLEPADRGQVFYEGGPLDRIPVHKRGFGLMFQDFALFPHKDVAANVAFGLRMQALPRSQVDARVQEMLALVGLEGYGQRRVYDLSGGEQQRVALARSLAPEPQLLMLDEPLGSLDRTLREELMNELRAILRQVRVTTVYVTHDQREAFAIADRVLIMHRGRIIQEGTPQHVYRYPASPRVARFLGLTNLIPGHVAALDPIQVDTVLGSLWPGQDARTGAVGGSHGEAAGQTLSIGQPVTILVRPEAAREIMPYPQPSGEGALDQVSSDRDFPFIGTVRECSFRGSYCRLVVRHETGTELVLEVLSDALHLFRPGKPIALKLRSRAIILLGETDEPSAAV